MIEQCPACGFEAEAVDGPVHAYLTHTPSCWARFNESMALHYSDLAFWASHQLLVDAYALQHSSGTDRRAVQSAAIHLVALVMQIENPDMPDRTAVRIRKAMAGRDAYPVFEPWPDASVTIAMVAIDDSAARHSETVKAYAQRVYEDWSDHHSVARDLISGALQ